MRVLLHLYQAAVSYCGDAVGEPLKVRLARRLLGQALPTDHHDPAAEIKLVVAQGDLAKTLGVSRSKLNEESRRMEKDDVLRLGYGKIFVRDVERLEGIFRGASGGVLGNL